MFDLNSGTTQSVQTTIEEEQVTRYTLEVESNESFEIEDNVSATPKRVLSAEEQQQRNKERLMKIQEYTQKLKKAEGIQELENEPAFRRRNVELDESIPSKDSDISRFSVSKNNDGGSSLNSNNSFLHDNVD